MKSILLVVFLAAAATAQVLSKEVPEVVEVPDVVEVPEVADDGDEVADVDLNQMPEVVVTDVDELTDVRELTDEVDVPAQTAVATRRNLNVGNTAGSALVYNSAVSANGVANHFHVRDITVRTNRRVSAVRVNRVGASQGATPSILNGGIGSSFVTIRIRSATSRGYHYRIQVYVR